MAQGIRSFIAFPVSAETAQAVSHAIMEWQRLPGDVRWTSVINMHLTLKFLGDVPPDQLAAVREALANAAAGTAPFRIQFGPLGAFPSWRRPRVLWIGPVSVPPQVAVLYEAMEREMSTLGFPREDRPFSPHLTLARIKQPYGLEQLTSRMQARQSVACPPFTVRNVTLFKSDLRPAGPVYTSLQTCDLALEDSDG